MIIWIWICNHNHIKVTKTFCDVLLWNRKFTLYYQQNNINKPPNPFLGMHQWAQSRAGCTQEVPLEQLEIFHHTQFKETIGYDVCSRSIKSVCVLHEKWPYKDSMWVKIVAEPSSKQLRKAVACLQKQW